jgi:rSAM/selenodomain-associated transferase 1
VKSRLIIMVKEPIPGRVKTRLGRDLGMVPAANWFRKQALRTIKRLDDPRWDLVLAVSPDHAGMMSRFWPSHIARVPQGRGDLGARMGRLLRASPSPKTCIIGADIPDIQPRHILTSFAALGSYSGVLGPSDDGGYWLVGLRHGKHAPAGLFDAVRWSTRFARADTIRSAKGLNWTCVDTLNDVDTVEDLKHLTVQTQRAL